METIDRPLGTRTATLSAECAPATGAFGFAEEVSKLKGLVRALPVGSASQMTEP
ncbi:hypothetical protein IW248_001273 [Micromonospora ureilytica]|uniref:Uncharacterized protein n=1 Tax=Micromonospora ureilytica TaxID=709868 RepID=A0ABS0JD90_9ACTN|nr:hypothetical protein [Micromonospora ureilytica]